MRRFLCVLGVLLASLPLVVPAPALGAPSVTVPSSVDATGASDVTEELRSFIASVPNGTTIAFAPGARYRIEGVLLVKGRRNLTFEGNGAEFFATTDGSGVEPNDEWYGRNWPRHRAHWVIHGGAGIVLRDIVVRGANPKGGPTNDAYVAALEAQHGIELAGVNGVTVQGCTVTDTYGDLVSVTRGSRNVTVSGCTLKRSGRQGVTVDNGQDVSIVGNVVADIGRSAFDLEPARADWLVERVRIEANVVGKANGVFVAAYGKGSNVNQVQIVGNELRGDPIMVLVKASEGDRRHSWRVVDNTSTAGFGSPLAPIRFTRVDGVEVRRNHQRIATTQSRRAVSASESCGVVVEDNEFPGATVPHLRISKWDCSAWERSRRFTDVSPFNVHAAAITRLAELGVMLGTGTGTFSPSLAVTRGQVATILERALDAAGTSLPYDGDQFRDDDRNVHQPAIDRLAAAGVVTGTAPGRYSPGDLVTRAQLASMIMRALDVAGHPVPSASPDAFTDDDDSVHEPAIDAAAALEVVAGTGDGRFSPGVVVRRDQAASILVQVVAALS